MLLKRNLLESLTIISCSGSLICILLNYVTNISPIKGVWFLVYIFSLFFVSVLCSFKFIQWLLHLNKPLTYDFDDLVKKYPFLSEILPRQTGSVKAEFKEYDTNELSVISTVLERRLVSSWYVPYVSQEIGFPFACKQMLDQIIGKTFQICSKIETKDVYIDICCILITHLKEYKKALKRHEKAPQIPIEQHYKKSHPIHTNSEKNYSSGDHCTNILRVILKDLVPWELWDTPHSELLVRVLAKKLDNFIDSSLSNPIWLNDKLMNILKNNAQNNHPTEEQKEDMSEETSKETGQPEDNDDSDKKDTKEVEAIVLKEIDLKPITTSIESALSTLITKSTAPILQRPIIENIEELETAITAEPMEETEMRKTDPVEIKTSPVLRQRRGRQGRNEVKIYDRIIEGSVKTWETDVDLQCISLGQDLLGLDGEITLSRLWGLEQEDSKQTPLWFGEEDALEMEVDSKEPSPVKKELSPKPAELLKDLQTTVHQAKTKIGDLQVPAHAIDVPRNNDEAAGMMEGLLDFGIAGLRKGLRFTGLSDDTQEKSPSHQKEKERSIEKASSQENTKKSMALDARELTSAVVAAREENNMAPPLVKQQRVASQDSVASQRTVPVPVPLAESPEPEYEEAADLSTSIAKLRTLLQQRAEATNNTEEVWWEGAEETRGHTHSHLQRSSRPVDSATLADEYDMQAERSSPGQPNNMQRLDRLFQRTVTGVFNSLRTAVAADGESAHAHADMHWLHVPTDLDHSVMGAVGRLVGSRRAYSHVDAALDSLQQLPPPNKGELPAPEDFEEWLGTLGLGWCACAELGCAAGLCGSHLAYRVATLLIADVAESIISNHLESVGPWLRREVFAAFERLRHEGGDNLDMAAFDVDETCATVMDRVPGQYIFGEETLKSSVRLVVTSFSHGEVNKDVICRVLDVLALHFNKSAGLRNPSFDNN